MINKKAVLVAMAAVFLSAWLVNTFLKSGLSFLPFRRAKADTSKQVLVAGMDIPQRQTLSEAMFVRQGIPKEQFNESMVTQLDPGASYALLPIVRGEILYRSKLGLVKDEPELSYLVDWNQGCVTIRINDVTGVSGLIKPGDYVDVYATYTFSKERTQEQSAAKKAEAITKRILTGLKVVATDIEVLPPVGGGVQNINRVRAVGDAKKVTLAAKSFEIEALVHAYNKAEIHLALISDALKKKRELAGFDTGIECIRGDKSEMFYVER